MGNRHNRAFRFRGGPLDGQTMTRTKTGRWPMYLAEDGRTPIKPSDGDRWRRNGVRLIYIHTEQADISVFPAIINHTYVHSSSPDIS
jgi:hypothetical protein